MTPIRDEETAKNIRKNIIFWLEKKFGKKHGNKTSLAREIGVLPADISAWTNGDRVPSESNLRKLAGAFGVKVPQLRGEAGSTVDGCPQCEPRAARIADLERENEDLRGRLAHAERLANAEARRAANAEALAEVLKNKVGTPASGQKAAPGVRRKAPGEQAG